MANNDFDSHQYAKRLQDAGLPAAIADIEAETMADVMKRLTAASTFVDGLKQHTDDATAQLLARIEASSVEQDAKIDATNTKIDATNIKIDAAVEQLGAKIDATNYKIDAMNSRIDATAARLDAKIADLRSELIRWVVTVGILQTGLVTALLLKLLLH